VLYLNERWSHLNLKLTTNRKLVGLDFAAHVLKLMSGVIPKYNGRGFGYKFASVEDNELIQFIDKFGVDKLVFMVPMRPVRSVFGLMSYTTSSDEPRPVPCVIEDDDRYSYKSGYKIKFRSLYP